MEIYFSLYVESWTITTNTWSSCRTNWGSPGGPTPQTTLRGLLFIKLLSGNSAHLCHIPLEQNKSVNFSGFGEGSASSAWPWAHTKLTNDPSRGKNKAAFPFSHYEGPVTENSWKAPFAPQSSLYFVWAQGRQTLEEPPGIHNHPDASG